MTSVLIVGAGLAGRAVPRRCARAASTDRSSWQGGAARALRTPRPLEGTPEW